eukprot:554779-Prorocentrum_lima.AAC.1
MTSSLVGSEMCIRDRTRIETIIDMIDTMLETPIETIIETSITPIIETVSYTHLTLPTICSV